MAMNRDFIQIKELEGDLKISHKKYDFGLTVSTREIVLQKPHVNYHLRLDDIFSIVPFDPPGGKGIPFQLSHYGNEITHAGTSGSSMYKVYAHKAKVHNRSGIFQLGPMEFILPIHRDLLLAISKYGGMDSVITDPGDGSKFF